MVVSITGAGTGSKEKLNQKWQIHTKRKMIMLAPIFSNSNRNSNDDCDAFKKMPYGIITLFFKRSCPKCYMVTLNYLFPMFVENRS